MTVSANLLGTKEQADAAIAQRSVINRQHIVPQPATEQPRRDQLQVSAEALARDQAAAATQEAPKQIEKARRIKSAEWMIRSYQREIDDLKRQIEQSVSSGGGSGYRAKSGSSSSSAENTKRREKIAELEAKIVEEQKHLNKE